MSRMSVGKKVGADMGLLAHETAPRPPPTFSTGNYQINLLHTVLLAVTPILAFGAMLCGVEFHPYTVRTLFAFICFGGLGITAGYHRLFSHRAYSAHPALQWFMAFAGASAFEGSIKWWARNHRIHHRYIDTDKDPYNANRGFWFTHIGWMIMKQDYEILGRVDMSDLNTNKIVRFQHDNYLPMALFSGVVLPTLICGLGWGDWVGGYFYAAVLKMVIIHHGTFCINSLAHTPAFGAMKNFSNKHTSHDSFICALITFGEGYHNFHHEFAQDYRNGIKWYHYDPTKWLIRGCEVLGLATNLVRTPREVIERNFSQTHHDMHERKMKEFAAKIEQLEDKTKVPSCCSWSWEEINDRVARGEKLMVVGDYVVDMNKVIPTGMGNTHSDRGIIWYNAHPGGRKYLDMYVGKDATEAFSGGIYGHSEGAFNLIKHLRVATLKHNDK